jgi:hypothetical protein
MNNFQSLKGSQLLGRINWQSKSKDLKDWKAVAAPTDKDLLLVDSRYTRDRNNTIRKSK